MIKFNRLKKIIVNSVLIVLVWAAASSYAQTENYLTKKIKLGEFETKNGFTSNGTYSVPWLELQTSHITLDDKHKIYILDKSSKKILLLSQDGILLKSITLNDADFKDKSEELGDDGYIHYQLQVSFDGSYFYITEGGNENKWSIYNSNGISIKKNVNQQWIKRTCDDKYIANSGLVELDNMLNVTKRIKLLTPIKKDEIIVKNNLISFVMTTKSDAFWLTKKMLDGKQLWRKKYDGKVLKILGADEQNNTYILIDKSLHIIKISNEGEKIATITLPKDPFFRDWRNVNFNVLCDGTIYCIPTYFALWKGKQKSGTGEYYIYKIEKQ